jgi:Flp pilus assembly protein TadD
VQTHGGRLAWLLCLLLAATVWAVYAPTLHHEFVSYDDGLYVTANSRVQAGLTLENVKWAFFRPAPVFGYWHPLTLLSHMLDCRMYGLNPWGHHLTSVLLHAANTGLVFLLLRGLTGAAWRSAAVAALFGLHPVHVESVAWVAERKDVLSTFFGLLSLPFYSRYARSKDANRKSQTANYPPAFFCLACGLMSKPMLVTWPFVMLLLDYWPLERFQTGSLWRLVREKIPFFALAVMAGIATFLISKHGTALAAGENLSLGARGGNALVSYCRYLGMVFWPVKLAAFYPHPGYWPLTEVLLAGGLLAGLSVVLFVQRRRYPFLLMGWLWFVGTLVPVIQLVQTGEHALADRYTYIPSLGLLIMVVWGAHEMTRGWRYQVMGLSAAGVVAIVLCAAMTRQQLGYWQNDETLFRHTLAVTENNHVAHNNFGMALLNEGRVDEAITQFQEAIRIKPDYALAYYNLGTTLDKKGQVDEAIGLFQEAVNLASDYADARNNLGLALLGKGRVDEAISQFQEIIRLSPDYVDAHINLGMALDAKGQTDAAISQLQEALRLKPDNAQAHYNLGTALLDKNQTAGAIRQFQEALRLKPDCAEFHNNLGIALDAAGQTDGAIRQFQEAVRLKPDYADARNNLAHELEVKSPAAGR